MAHKEGAGRGSRDQRMNRHHKDYMNPEDNTVLSNPEDQGFSNVSVMRHRSMNYRPYGIELSDGNGEAFMRREQFDYGHTRKRSRSPFSQRNSLAEKQHEHINTLLRDESLQITVGNEKFRSPPSGQSLASSTGDNIHAGSFLQGTSAATGRTSGYAHEQNDYAEETASLARAKEMAMRTREMLSKLTGWNPIGLKPPPKTQESVKAGETPNFLNISNSAYTRLDASSEMAQTLLRNINAVAAAFCPKESGGITHIKYGNATNLRKPSEEDEDKFLYGEELIPKNALNSTLPRQPAVKSSLVTSGFSDPSSLSLAKPSAKTTGIDSDCDPAVTNVLKSIGFNFELSKVMQEKAKKEREENEKNRLLIEQASSFLAKQLGTSNLKEEPKAVDKLTKVIINSEAKKRERLHEKGNDIDVLYDEFSNSEDEFCDSEKKNWKGFVSGVGSELSSAVVWPNESLATSMSSGINFPSPVLSKVPLLPTPSVVVPMSATVPPPHINIPPPPIILPPTVLQPPPPLPIPQIPLWPVYHMPSSAGKLPKQKPVSQKINEVEWEQNTEDFLRRLQEPRTTELSSKRDARPRSSSRSSTEGERRRTRPLKKRSLDREFSRSPERKGKKGKYDSREISERREASADKKEDNECREISKQLSFLKEQLKSLRKEHSHLMHSPQKSLYSRNKLARNRRQQDEVSEDIRDLAGKLRTKNVDRDPSASSDDKGSFDRGRQGRSKRSSPRTRHSHRHSRELSKEKERENSASKNREASVERKKELSKRKATRRSSAKEKGCIGSPERERKLTKEETEIKGEGNAKSTGLVLKEESGSVADKHSVKKEKDDICSSSEIREPTKSKMKFDCSDGGDHWCSICRTAFIKPTDFLEHLHTDDHKKLATGHPAPESLKPWALCRTSPSRSPNRLSPVSEPATGMEFMMAIKGFFCSLCQQFSGDKDDAELHVVSKEHRDKFKQHCLDNPSYRSKYHAIKSAKQTVKKPQQQHTQMTGKTEKMLDVAPDAKISAPGAAQPKLQAKMTMPREASLEKNKSVSSKRVGGVHMGKLPLLRSKKKQSSSGKDSAMTEETRDAVVVPLSGLLPCEAIGTTGIDQSIVKESDLVSEMQTTVEIQMDNSLSSAVVQRVDEGKMDNGDGEPCVKGILSSDADKETEEAAAGKGNSGVESEGRTPVCTKNNNEVHSDAQDCTDVEIKARPDLCFTDNPNIKSLDLSMHSLVPCYKNDEPGDESLDRIAEDDCRTTADSEADCMTFGAEPVTETQQTSCNGGSQENIDYNYRSSDICTLLDSGSDEASECNESVQLQRGVVSEIEFTCNSLELSAGQAAESCQLLEPSSVDATKGCQSLEPSSVDATKGCQSLESSSVDATKGGQSGESSTTAEAACEDYIIISEDVDDEDSESIHSEALATDVGTPCIVLSDSLSNQETTGDMNEECSGIESETKGPTNTLSILNTDVLLHSSCSVLTTSSSNSVEQQTPSWEQPATHSIGKSSFEKQNEMTSVDSTDQKNELI